MNANSSQEKHFFIKAAFSLESSVCNPQRDNNRNVTARRDECSQFTHLMTSPSDGRTKDLTKSTTLRAFYKGLINLVYEPHDLPICFSELFLSISFSPTYLGILNAGVIQSCVYTDIMTSILTCIKSSPPWIVTRTTNGSWPNQANRVNALTILNEGTYSKIALTSCSFNFCRALVQVSKLPV